jgi:hypothetical protein
MDFTHLTISSFHRSNGARIDDTALATNPQVLLPIVNGALAGCCKQDIKFVCVQCTLDFAKVAGLITIDPYLASTMIRALYYIELPQGSRTLTNGAGAPCNLVSFLGAANLRTLTPAQVHVDILLVVQQDAPVLLQAYDFNLDATNTDSNNISIEIQWKIFKLAWHQICASVFAEMCIGYTNQPQAALYHIQQSYVDGEGNHVCIPVFA